MKNLALIVLFAVGATSAQAERGFLSVSPTSVLRLDAQSGTLSALASVPNVPGLLALEPTGRFLYVLQTNGTSGSLIKLDTSSGSVISSLPLPVAPSWLALSPDGSKAFVSLPNRQSVAIITTASLVMHEIFFADDPGAIAVNHAGTRLYVVTAHSPPPSNGTVVVVDLVTEAPLANVSVGVGAGGIEIDAQDTTIYVSHQAAPISVIDALSNSVISTLPATGYWMTLDPSQRKLFVSETLGSHLFVVDLRTSSIVGTVTFSGPPQTAPGKAVFSNDTGRVYVPQAFANYVAIIDASSYQIVGSIPTGGSAVSLVFPQSASASTVQPVPTISRFALLIVVLLVILGTVSSIKTALSSK